jgi:two-component system, cell cycle response regulator
VTDDYREGGTLILARPLGPTDDKKPPAGDACLVNLHPPGPDIGKRVPLLNPQYVVGRDSEAQFVVSRSSVSRQHARLYSDEEGAWWVEDLSSTNGTFVNESRVKTQRLSDSDQVRFGDAIYKFLSGSNIESAYHEAIHNMAIQDGMTGIHNKRYFLEFLEREIARCARYRRPLSLLMFDIDHFKQINDKHGHLTGDYVLRELSRRLLGRVRREELLARYGGEEFAAVLPETDITGARTFGEQVRRLVGDQPFEYEGDTFPVTVSVGVACVEGEDVDVTQFIKIADDNLYKAKREGRDRVVG